MQIDKAYEALNIFDDELSLTIWEKKYKHGDEQHPHDSFKRVVDAVYVQDPDDTAAPEALEAMKLGLWNPGGRIHAGAGTALRVTLMNCYVMANVGDSMSDIADVLKDSMLTMQQGGGIGVNFSEIRPSGAYLHRTGAAASGPLPFMHMWDGMCTTIMSAGSRRGAMMATICDTHPDLLAFVNSKKEMGKLTNFNISVLISDAFMSAVENEQMWDLFFHLPMDGKKNSQRTFVDEKGVTQYVYDTINASELWNTIMATTYKYSEPGVIFIDKVNEINNLQYCEEIACTNPCAEIPLPPHGCCNLGSINLALLVRNPLKGKSKGTSVDDHRAGAHFDFDLLKKIVKIGVRFLDNVIDITNYPLEEQRKEELSKRRIGLGVTGLADAFALLDIRYGSPESLKIADTIFAHIAFCAYETSAELAKERGSFPLYTEEYLESPFLGRLPASTITSIKSHGIRNGVLLTVAPTGTTSIYYGNVSSGIEPIFAHEFIRKVQSGNDPKREYTVKSFSNRFFKAVFPGASLPEHMVTTSDLTVEEHIRMQATAQKYIDASISKTVNCAEDISFEDFREVYSLAFTLGCKGCTTYRPSEVRGSVLSLIKPEDSKAKIKDTNTKTHLLQRPTVLHGVTHKIKWPSQSAAIYVTINYHPITDKPFEVFFNSKNATNQEWMTALSLMVSSIMRINADYKFIAEELMQIVSAHDSCWVEGKYYKSLPAYLGHILNRHLVGGDATEGGVPETAEVSQASLCPVCNSPLTRAEGCVKCTSCLYTKCE